MENPDPERSSPTSDAAVRAAVPPVVFSSPGAFDNPETAPPQVQRRRTVTTRRPPRNPN
ncbi:hypothetical protein QLQ12_12180 [Actinoplanes sp. NEAU-A12]|uniref:Uncharacterized protein n=1 Tax=Actinoplanes sandaracinus TaxID=3045177 RepID=A0ABT6WI50_9ACTN|nr:hypothetical protein [Actinoplanes sandaracinus]MDI6099350.1 hypothetical protein [Actinoplanes sandaracinus]